MKTMKGPAIFLAQFAGDKAPFNSLSAIAGWAASLGYEGVQIPTWDARLFDLEQGGEIEDVLRRGRRRLPRGRGRDHGALDSSAGPAGRRAPRLRRGLRRASRRRRCAAIRRPGSNGRSSRCSPRAKASRNLGLKASVTFSGALAWPYLYPWPPRSPGLIEAAFDELAKRWRPIFDAYDEAGVDVAFELHPGEDLMDGATFEMFLERVGGHPRCGINYDPSHFVLQQLDYVDFIDIYHERINAFHVKDAEFNPTGRQGVYSGFQGWVKRAGRFRSLGDGQVDFGAIFSKLAAVRLRPLAGARMGVRAQASRAGRGRGRAVHRAATSSASPSTPSTTSPAARTDDGGQQEGARDLSVADAETMAIGTQREVRGPHPPRHGGRRAGRLHRRGAPHRGAHRRPVRARRRRALLRPGARQGVRRRARPARGPRLRQLRGDGAARGAAQGRHRGGRHRHAEPHALPGRQGVPAARHPRHLRQAADGEPARTRRSSPSWCEKIGQGLRAHAQLHRLPDGPAGARDGRRRRARRDPRSSTPSMCRTGSRPTSRRPARSRRNGAPIRRARASAAPSATSARTPTTSPASSPGSRPRRSRPTSRASSRAARSTTTCT